LFQSNNFLFFHSCQLTAAFSWLTVRIRFPEIYNWTKHMLKMQGYLQFVVAWKLVYVFDVLVLPVACRALLWDAMRRHYWLISCTWTVERDQKEHWTRLLLVDRYERQCWNESDFPSWRTPNLRLIFCSKILFFWLVNMW
jgi:hypothetical protein